MTDAAPAPPPHREVWRRGDRPELRCTGVDGFLRCHLIVGHAPRCRG